MAARDDNQTIADEVPWSELLTAYDQAHLVVYLRLLDASADGASQDEMADVILGINPGKEPSRAARAVESHLRRARWMMQVGYRHLLTH
jgi:hypothetical protein